MVKSENPITDRKKMMSRESSTPFLEAFEMGHDAEGGDEVREPGAGELFEDVDDRREARQDEEQADHDRDNEAHHLAAREGRGDATDGQVSSGHQPASQVSGQDDAVVRVPR